MAQSTYFPTRIDIHYSSEFAPHEMKFSGRVWSPPAGTDLFGSFLNWEDVLVDAETMIDDMIASLAQLFTPQVNFNGWEIWTYATPTSPAIFKQAKSTSVTGSLVSTAQRKAVQTTYNLLADDGSQGKVVLLDAPVLTFDRIVGIGALNAAELAVINHLLDSDEAWSSKANGMFTAFRSRTTTLNEKLRREYHMD